MKRLAEELGLYWVRAEVVRSGGPERVQVGEHDPNFKPRPVGFTANLTGDVEPELWDGDQA